MVSPNRRVGDVTIQEILGVIIIQPSQISFSSPVMMVIKNDGLWCMCLEYKYIYKMTIKHNFPIFVIDELLVELHGAIFFTNLELHFGYH